MMPTPPTPNIIDAGDVLVVGAGLAGIFTALKLAPRPVTVLAAGKRSKGSASNWAQGGIAAALAENDSPANHARDTIAAGDGLVNAGMAHVLAEEAGARIADLAAYGVPFDRDAKGRFRLGREAAHSHNRIVGVGGDRAGREIMSALITRAIATPSISFMEGFAAYELAVENGRVVGVFARPAADSHFAGPIFIRARATILATGGIGHLYAVTTNPRSANGEALAMAARAGAHIADAEFVQFHPTALTGMGDPAPLATEALRGEGARLINRHGHRFMPDIHPDAELAPRDIVARAVFHQIGETGAVGLDLRGKHTHGLAEALETRFPTVYASCIKAGIDPTRQVLPVAPATHFHMGGIRTDAHGRSSVPGLWVCGEAACTGVHGANRLASNSLLEAVVFGARIAEDVNHSVPHSGRNLPQPPETEILDSPNMLAPATRKLRQLMSDHVGVLRHYDGLVESWRALQQLSRAGQGHAPFCNMVLAAQFITRAALAREESRGGHARTDFPAPAPDSRNSDFLISDLTDFSPAVAPPADKRHVPVTL